MLQMRFPLRLLNLQFVFRQNNNSPVQAAMETAGGGLTKNRRGYKNNRLAAARLPNRRLTAAYGGG